MDINIELLLERMKGIRNNTMKGLALVLVTLVLHSCGQFKKKPEAVSDGSSRNNEMPVIHTLFEDLTGNPISLADYKGKKVLLNFWATWCKPCTEEMSALLRAKDILEKENYVFLLASDESIDKIKDFKEDNNFNLVFIRFTGALHQFKIYALPKTFIYNGKGEKVEEISGAVAWDSEKMIGELKNIQ